MFFLPCQTHCLCGYSHAYIMSFQATLSHTATKYNKPGCSQSDRLDLHSTYNAAIMQVDKPIIRHKTRSNKIKSNCKVKLENESRIRVH